MEDLHLLFLFMWREGQTQWLTIMFGRGRYMPSSAARHV